MRPGERHLVLSWRFYAEQITGPTATTGESVEEGESEESTTTTEALLAEVEGIMLPKI